MNPTTTRRLRTVQIRTTAVAMATVVIVLGLGAVGLVEYFEREQIHQVDRRLEDAAVFVPQAAGAANASPTAVSAGITADVLVQAVNPDGKVVFASERLRGRPAMRIVGAGADSAQPTTAFVDQVGSVRVVAIPLQEKWVLLADSLQGVDDAVSGLTTALLLGVPMLALVLGLVVWIVVGRTLRPVREAIDHEQRLVADVSHELRTPIAGVRALLESESQIPEEIELNRLDALAELTRLESIAQGLLTEARNEHTHPLATADLIDLDEVVLRVIDVSHVAGIDIDSSAVSGGQVRGDEQDLERMISNLMANAARHARAHVRVAVTEHDDLVIVSIADDGPGIAPQDRQRVFERFTRLDDARSRDQGGVGLGLAIARSIALAHGGDIAVSAADAGGAAFVVTLPASVSGALTPSCPSATSTLAAARQRPTRS